MYDTSKRLSMPLLDNYSPQIIPQDLCLFTHSGLQDILCCVCLHIVFSNAYCVVFVYTQWSPTHIVLCLFTHSGLQDILCCVCLHIVVSKTYCIVFLFCFSSSYVPYVAIFSGLSIFDCTFGNLQCSFIFYFYISYRNLDWEINRKNVTPDQKFWTNKTFLAPVVTSMIT